MPEPLTGTWEELAAIPGEDGAASSVVVLADGRIALFRWTVPDSEAMVIYDPALDAWEVPTFDGQLPGVGTDQAFVLGVDDRVYTHDYRLAVEGDTWRREPFQLVRETDTWAGMPLASGRMAASIAVPTTRAPTAPSSSFTIHQPTHSTGRRPSTAGTGSPLRSATGWPCSGSNAPTASSGTTRRPTLGATRCCSTTPDCICTR